MLDGMLSFRGVWLLVVGQIDGVLLSLWKWRLSRPWAKMNSTFNESMIVRSVRMDRGLPCRSLDVSMVYQYIMSFCRGWVG